MKRFLRLALWFFLTGLGFAQNPLTTSQLNVPFTPLQTVQTANVTVVGNPGLQTYYYWTVANYQVGTGSPSGPFLAASAPTTLSASNYVTVTPVYPPGATLDILRTTSPTPPTGICNCAVVTGVATGTILDQSNGLNSYTVAPGFLAPNYTLSLDNEAVGTGATDLILRQNGNFVVDLSLAGGGGSGTVTGPSASAVGDLTCWNNVTGTLLSDCGVGLPLPNSSLQHNSVTVNGTTIALGGANTITAVPSGACGGDLGGTFPGCSVQGVAGVPLCTGVVPVSGYALEYTTASSPNPCLTYGTAGSLVNPMTTLGDTIYGGASGTPMRLAGATSPNGVPQVSVSIPSGGVATAPVRALPGIVGRAVTGTTSTDTIVSTDCNPKRIEYVGTVSVAVTLPTATTLGVPQCSFKLVNSTASSTVTVTPTTWTVNGNPTLPILAGKSAIFFVDPNSSTNWVTDGPSTTGAVGRSDQTALTGSLGTTNLIASTSAAGTYRINYYLDQNGLCASGSDGITLTVNWTDASNARVATSISLTLGSAQLTGNFVQGILPIFAAASTAISYSSTLTGSCSGASYDAHLVLEAL